MQPINEPAKFFSRHRNGQWLKKINQKQYYFGSIAEDPTATRALAEYNDRIAGILGGTDHLRHLEAGKGQTSVDAIRKLFIEQQSRNVAAGTMSKLTWGGYVYELGLFVDWVKPGTAVAALKPEHFAGYATYLLTERKLKSRARKRALANIKRLFRWGAGNGHCPLPPFGEAFKAPSTTQQAIRKERARAGLVDHSKRIVTGAEVDKLLAASQPNFRAMILLGINCGLGPADIGRLKWRHLDLEHGRLNYPRHKTGNERIGYLWKRTREALLAARETKWGKLEWEQKGQDGLVFLTRKRLPYYREVEVKTDGKVVGVSPVNALSLTFGRMAKKLGLDGVTFYRLRHSFKTYGKKAKDRDALNLMMGHRANTVEEGYDHEDIGFARIKRVALKVKSRLWPTPRRRADTTDQPSMRIVGDGRDAAGVRERKAG